MKKFPVTSRRGNEYTIKIRHEYEEFYVICIYETKVFLGITYLSRINPDLDLFGIPRYNGYYHNFDFVKMAQIEIERVESDFEGELRRQKKVRDGVNRFQEWDGKC